MTFNILILLVALAGLPLSILPASPATAAYQGIDATTLARLRTDFQLATDSSQATHAAIAFLDSCFPSPQSSWPPVAQAYRASLEGLIGKHATNLFEKLNRVNAAIAAYHGLVEAWPDTLEIRFMRFAFYVQLPGIFGVGKYVAPDRAQLVDMLERADDTMVPAKQRLDMIAWILTEGRPSPLEVRRLQLLGSRLAP
jgi:hypothetical protein